MKPASSFYVKVELPSGAALETREALAVVLTRVASRFSFQGLEDYTVELSSGEKVLGAEREFHDLRGRGKMNDEMRVYFGKKTDGTIFGKLVKSAFEDLKIAAPRALGKKDWMKEWRKHYRTQIVREGKAALAIVPAWKKPPATPKVSVKIWPGQAFGTGTHSTTRLCLKAFLKAAPSMPTSLSLLDFGAGTGVLALGAQAWAAKAGMKIKAVAVESDPQALEQAGKNARLNRRELRLCLKMPKAKPYDFVFANVLAPVLLLFKKELAASVKPGGLMVLSGILATESESFRKKFAQKELEYLGTELEGDWAALLWRRKA